MQSDRSNESKKGASDHTIFTHQTIDLMTVPRLVGRSVESHTLEEVSAGQGDDALVGGRDAKRQALQRARGQRLHDVHVWRYGCGVDGEMVMVRGWHRGAEGDDWGRATVYVCAYASNAPSSLPPSLSLKHLASPMAM